MPRSLKWFLCILIGCSWINLAQAADSTATASNSQTSDAATAKQAPAIEIPHPNYDFGVIDQGKTIKHDFIVKNTGPGTLRIKQVRPG